MSFKLIWMPDVLLKTGLKVAECDGWRTRGRSEMGTVRGVMLHHTGNPAPGNMPTLEILKRGRPDLRGPLCNLGLGRDGTFYVVAAGRANHAGPGRAQGITTGNSSFIGIEAEHSGDRNDPWPPAQLQAYQRGVAALLRHIGAGAELCVAHKEYALPVGRKIDPCFDMMPFRIAVADYLAGKSEPPPVRAADEEGRTTLFRGMEVNADIENEIELLQEKLGVRADGIFGPKTESALREWQRAQGLDENQRPVLNADGVCGPKTWAALLGRLAADGAAPPASPSMAKPNGHLSLGQKGAELIKEFEGCHKKIDGKFHAYPDPGSRNKKPWTIGWGSTGKDIFEGVSWDQDKCDARFEEDMQRYVNDVNRALGGAKTNQNQFDALVSFHYNTGAIGKATLTKLHREGKFEAAAGEFGKWIKNDGKVMRGLVRRREAEADLYGQP